RCVPQRHHLLPAPDAAHAAAVVGAGVRLVSCAHPLPLVPLSRRPFRHRAPVSPVPRIAVVRAHDWPLQLRHSTYQGSPWQKEASPRAAILLQISAPAAPQRSPQMTFPSLPSCTRPPALASDENLAIPSQLSRSQHRCTSTSLLTISGLP